MNERALGLAAQLEKRPASNAPLLQRACACGKHAGSGGECAECRKKRLGLQRRAVGNGPDVAPPIIHEVLRSAGRPLDDETRDFMESRFNHDFSGVRVHADARAAESARAVNALAYTVGDHVAFGAGQFAPGSSAGRRLLAHELAHVVQQGGAHLVGSGSSLPVDDNMGLELEAAAAGRAVELGEQLQAHAQGRKTGLRRQEEPVPPALTPVPIVLENVVVTHHANVVTEAIRAALEPIARRGGRRLEFRREGFAPLRLIFESGGRDETPCAGIQFMGMSDGTILVGALEDLRVCGGPQGTPQEPDYVSQIERVFDPESPLFGRAVGNTAVHELGHMIADLEHSADEYNFMFSSGPSGANLPRWRRTLETMRRHWAGPKEFSGDQQTRLVAAFAADRFVGGPELESRPPPGSRQRRRSGGGRLQRQRARDFDPILPKRESLLPPIEPPPVPQPTSRRADCPNATEAGSEIRSSNLIDEVETTLRSGIELERSRTAVTRPRDFSRGLIQRANRAIRAEFGQWLPRGLDLTRRGELTAKTPQAFSRLRVPDDTTARLRIGQAALLTSARVATREANRFRPHTTAPVNDELFDILLRLCIDRADHPILRAEISEPLLRRVGIDMVRDYDLSHIGGQTAFAEASSGGLTRHVDIPTAHRYMGHILVHEAIHYYVSAEYFRTASGHPLEEQLLEGGAEFLTRHVVHNRLDNDPDFRLNYDTYEDEFHYVQDHLLRGGLSSFALAYFQGHVDLLGLTPPGGATGRTETRPQLQRQIANPEDELRDEFRQARRRALGRDIEGMRFHKVISEWPEGAGGSMQAVGGRLRDRVIQYGGCEDC